MEQIETIGSSNSIRNKKLLLTAKKEQAKKINNFYCTRKDHTININLTQRLKIGNCRKFSILSMEYSVEANKTMKTMKKISMTERSEASITICHSSSIGEEK